MVESTASVNHLRRIVEQRRRRMEESRAAVPLEEIRARAASAPPPRGFLRALRTRRAIVTEIKRASPSRPNLALDLDAAVLAREYESAGARALSVLTEPDFFRGSASDLIAARAATSLPILRKDFLVDEYQVFESRAIGADAILLIAAALPPDEFRALHALALSLGMDVLAEVHTARELAFALQVGCPLIGINNRDLSTLQVDPLAALPLIRHVPRGKACIVIESGLRDSDDLVRYHRAGADAFLIGESLLRASSPRAALRSFLRTLEAEP